MKLGSLFDGSGGFPLAGALNGKRLGYKGGCIEMIHVGTSIAGLEALSDYRLGKLAHYIKIDGVPLRTAAQVRRMLKEARAAGLEVLPAEGCDNYDSRGMCKGHSEEKKHYE